LKKFLVIIAFLGFATWLVLRQQVGPVDPLTDLTDPSGRDLAYQLGRDGRPEIWSIHEASVSEANLRWQFWSEEAPAK
jgi:hypothetical protein